MLDPPPQIGTSRSCESTCRSMPVMSKTEQIIAVVNAMLTQLPEKVIDCPNACEEGVCIARFITSSMRGDPSLVRRLLQKKIT